MARKGETYTQVPTLWHLGIGEPFSIMRKRKGDTRWRKVAYCALTRSSALRWERLVRRGLATRRRDVNQEALAQMGIVTLAGMQESIRKNKAEARLG